MLPKILLILAVIFMIGSGYLGFQNKSKIDATIVDRDTAKNAVASASAEAATAKKSLKEASDKLTTVTAKVTEMEQQVSAKEADLAKATAEVTNLTAQLTGKTAEVDAKNAELEALKVAPIAATTEIPITESATQVAELTAQIEALKSEKQIIGDKLISAEAKAQELGDVVSKAKNAIMAKGLEGQVIAVNQAWGFVVLNLGDRSGVVSNAEMVVMREGDRVGKIKITSVEPSSSIADIVSDSVAAGQRVLPGDRVIYAGN